MSEDEGGDTLDLTESKGELSLSTHVPVTVARTNPIQYRTLDCEGNIESNFEAFMTLDETTKQFIIQVTDRKNPSFFLVIRIPEE